MPLSNSQERPVKVHLGSDVTVDPTGHLQRRCHTLSMAIGFYTCEFKDFTSGRSVSLKVG